MQQTNSNFSSSLDGGDFDVMAFNFGGLYDRLNEVGFQDVQSTENPSDDVVQAKTTEILNDPDAIDIKVSSYSFGQEQQLPNQGGLWVSLFGLADLMKKILSLGSPTNVIRSQSNAPPHDVAKGLSSASREYPAF